MGAPARLRRRSAASWRRRGAEFESFVRRRRRAKTIPRIALRKNLEFIRIVMAPHNGRPGTAMAAPTCEASMAFRLQRRDFLMAAGAAAAGVALPWRPARAASKDILWSTWNNLGLEDYIDAVHQETGIKVDQTYITTDDEQFAKFRAGGAADVDVFVPGQWEMSRYIASNLVQPLDLSKVPNAAQMYPVFRDLPLGEEGRQDLRAALLLGHQHDRLSRRSDGREAGLVGLLQGRQIQGQARHARLRGGGHHDRGPLSWHPATTRCSKWTIASSPR